MIWSLKFFIKCMDVVVFISKLKTEHDREPKNSL